ncbi:tetratricopeptide repeat protein [Ornithinibacillus californiensis]|uniref:tetratricopeptide repeat protein n=1 Tax=Ornithinibacillus californiensis TaxID=161536 RepID=UPI00064E02A9|nr:tetratricopeptide repeat protein [Ornithinibacillus californiensis]
MQHEEENVILFPKWETILKEESFQALQQKRYEEALDKLNELLHYHVNDHEIIIGKLMCLMELGRYKEAEDMCEEIIRNRDDEHYFHYVHIYLTILFQTNKYDILMERIKEELDTKDLPSMLREQFMQLYDMSEKMESELVEQKSSVYVDDLIEAVSTANHEKQWRSIVKLRSMHIEPEIRVIKLLVKEEIHPVIKTAIFLWLQEQNFTNSINIHKFGKQLQVIPTDIPTISLHSTYEKTVQYLHDIEQDNPTLYQFLEQLLYRYLYVQYPIAPPNEDAAIIAESLIIIGYQIMNQQEVEPNTDKEKVLVYLKDILNGEQLYLSIIED